MLLMVWLISYLLIFQPVSELFFDNIIIISKYFTMVHRALNVNHIKDHKLSTWLPCIFSAGIHITEHSNIIHANSTLL
jgi:hypothetical protein